MRNILLCLVVEARKCFNGVGLGLANKSVSSFTGGLTYRVVGLDDPTTTYTTQSAGGAVQLLSSSLNGQYYVIGSPQEVVGKTIVLNVL